MYLCVSVCLCYQEWYLWRCVLFTTLLNCIMVMMMMMMPTFWCGLFHCVWYISSFLNVPFRFVRSYIANFSFCAQFFLCWFLVVSLITFRCHYTLIFWRVRFSWHCLKISLYIFIWHQYIHFCVISCSNFVWKKMQIHMHWRMACSSVHLYYIVYMLVVKIAIGMRIYLFWNVLVIVVNMLCSCRCSCSSFHSFLSLDQHKWINEKNTVKTVSW